MKSNNNFKIKNCNLGLILILMISVLTITSCEDELLKKKTERCEVNFDSTGGSEVPSQSVFIGTTIRKTDNPQKELAFFAGWYKEPELIHTFSYSMLVEHNMTLYAKWKPGVVVQFNSNGGTSIENDTIPLGDTAIKPVDPSKNNSVFIAWYEDEGLSIEFDFPNTNLENDITLYAKWIDGITLSFETNSSATVQSIGLLPGEFVTKPIDPIVEDSTFMGWYTDASLQTPFDFNSAINGNTTAHAKWFQNIYTTTVYPTTGVPQYYLITGLKPGFQNTANIYIPQNIGGIPVTRLQNEAFSGNTDIIEVYMEEGITHINNNVFLNCINMNILRLPTTLTNIGNYAFRNCSSLSGELRIPESIKGWGGGSFMGCSSIEKVYFPLAYTTVSNNCFNGCASLKELYIPSIIIDAVTGERKPINAANVNVIAGTHTDLVIYVPADLVAKYKTATNWSTYESRFRAMP